MEREKIQARVDTFRKFASQQGWSIAAEREINETTYQIKVTNGVSKVPIDFYRTGTVLIQGKPSELQSMLKSWWTQQKMQQHPSSLWDKDSLSTQALPPSATLITSKVIDHPKIGCGEAGREDYFGPFVVAAVYIDERAEARLADLGIRDSKMLPANVILFLAEEIKKLCCGQGNMLSYCPERYNEVYKEIPHLTQLRAMAHARVITKLQQRVPCNLAVVDQFGDTSLIGNALTGQGCTISMEQSTNAEDDIAVATASIIARAEFIRQIGELSHTIDIDLPEGISGSKVILAGRKIVTKCGQNMLAKVAKLHFKTTQEILSYL